MTKIGENVDVQVAIDWIAVTFKETLGKDFAEKIGYKTWCKDVEGVPPRGYTQCRELESGARVCWHEMRSEQGVHVQLGGAALRWYDEKGIDAFSIAVCASRFGGRLSRVDLAIDVRGAGWKLDHFAKRNYVPTGKAGRIPKPLPVGTQEDGWTVYLGARSSDKMLRIYDKGRELGEENSDYVRVEVEAKGEVAHLLTGEIPRLGGERLMGLAAALVNSMGSFNIPYWESVMQLDSVEIGRSEGRERGTMKWLLEICAPALAKEIDRRPNDGVLQAFISALEQALAERDIDLLK